MQSLSGAGTKSVCPIRGFCELGCGTRASSCRCPAGGDYRPRLRASSTRPQFGIEGVDRVTSNPVADFVAACCGFIGAPVRPRRCRLAAGVGAGYTPFRRRCQRC